MHNPAPVPENDTHKLLWDFNIQTDQLIPARRPDLITIKKKKITCKIVDFAVPVDHRIIWRNVQRRISTSTLLENWKNCGTWRGQLYQLWFWYSNKRIIKRPGRLGSWWTGRDYPNDSTVENSQNPETSPEDLRRFAVIQTPVKIYQLTLMCYSKGVIMVIISGIRNSTSSGRINWKVKLEENNCKDISSDKLTKHHTRRPGQG